VDLWRSEREAIRAEIQISEIKNKARASQYLTKVIKKIICLVQFIKQIIIRIKFNPFRSST